MSHSTTAGSKVRIALIIAIILVLIPTITIAAGAGVAQTGPEQDLFAVRDRVTEAGSYRFMAGIEQTLMPRPVASMIGNGDMHLDLRMAGDVVLPDQATLYLRVAGIGEATDPVIYVQDGDRSFIQRGEELVPSQAAGGVAAPNNDFLEYLNAAVNVQVRQEGDQQVYTFDISGERYAQYVYTKVAQADPASASILQQPPGSVGDASGHGEVWIDAQGLPVHHEMTLRIPKITDEYDLELRTSVDFYDFGAVDTLSQPVQDEDGIWHLENLPASPPTSGSQTSWRNLASSTALPPTLSLTLIILGLAIVVMLAHRRWPRQVYVALAVTVVILMTMTPLLRPLGIARLSTQRAHAAEQLANPIVEALQTQIPPPQIGTETTDEAQIPPPQIGTETADEARTVEAYQPQAPNAAPLPGGIPRCGTLASGQDTDKDGLDDLRESCIGTDPYYTDTDRDRISDDLEVLGFSFGGQTWTTDPFRSDSNNDGIPDMAEWVQPIGPAPSWDPDGDQIPNVWDDDNDGDGVYDAIDASPYARTGYLDSYQVSTQGGSFQGYQTIDIQIQPEDMSRVRYTATALDWPDGDNDEEDGGQIVDLDDSKEDVRLFPMLRVITNQRPDVFGVEDSVIILDNLDTATKDNYPHRLLIPLTPIGDGGDLVTFGAKVRYAPSEINSIRWEKVELIWLAETTLDSAKTGRVVPTPATLRTYVDRFRVTGLNIGLSGETEIAILGAPTHPNNDRPLFNILFGLNSSFTTHQNPDVDEIELRFSQPNTPITLTWGIPATEIEVDAQNYTSLESALLDTYANRVPLFLKNYYPTSRSILANTTVTPTLIFAHESDGANLNLDDADLLQPGNTFASNVADAIIQTHRGVSISMYKNIGMGEWRQLDDVEAMTAINQRYANLDTVVNALKATYPDITASDVRGVILLQYATWLSGAVMSVVALGGQYIVPVGTGYRRGIMAVPADSHEHAVAAYFTQANSTHLGEYLLGVTMLGQPGGGLVNLDSSIARSQVLRGQDPNTAAVSLAYEGLTELYGMKGDTVYGDVIVQDFVKNGVKGIKNVVSLARAYKNFDVAETGLKATTKTMATALKTGSKAGSKAAWGIFKNLGKATKAFKALGVVANAIAIGMAWYAFAQAMQSGDPVAQHNALGYAIAATILYTVLTVCSFIPPCNVVADILGLLDALLYFITGGKVGLFDTIITIMSPLSAKYLTSLKDHTFPPPDFDFSTKEAAEGIPLTGERFIIAGGFEGNIEVHKLCGGITDFFNGFCIQDLAQNIVGDGWGPEKALTVSRVQGSYFAKPSGQATISLDNRTPAANGADEKNRCVAENDRLVCKNQAGVAFRFSQANYNIPLTFRTGTKYIAAFNKCYKLGVTPAYCELKGNEELIPKEEEDYQWTTLHFDVFPDTVSGIWTWNVLGNPDPDGDGLTTTEENSLGTKPDDWDTDKDGLSDSFEHQTKAILGADPLKADSDGDGLPDGYELRAGTKINQPDTDGDGLSDGEEVAYRDAQGNWHGGWTAKLPNGLTVHVYSDPTIADADGDGLTDKAEKSSNTSPYAINEAPRLTLTATPLAQNPSGAAGTYVEPGDAVQLDVWLFNGSPFPVDSELRVCLPGFLGNVQGGDMGGERHPPKVQSRDLCGSAAGTVFTWNFGSSQGTILQQGETAHATITAVVPGDYPQSITDHSRATMPYLDGRDEDGDGKPDQRTLHEQALFVVDKDNPEVVFTAPENNQYLRGTTYIVGGTAADVSSWVTQVEVDLADGNGFLAANSTGPWARSWTLPTDGVYTLQARSRDYLDHTSTVGSVNVTVDNTPPNVNMAVQNLIDGVIYIKADQAGGTDVALSGTATDNLSGVRRAQISIDNRPWKEVTFANDAWTYTWKLPGRDAAQGEHIIKLRAFDRSGNVSAVVSHDVVVDVLAPTSNLTDSTFQLDPPPNIPSGQPYDFFGYLNDNGRGPLPARPNALVGTLDILADATIWLEPHSIRDTTAGAKAAWLGDFDGDRQADLVVGLPAADGGKGRVIVVYGQPGDWPIPPLMKGLDKSLTTFVGDTGQGIGKHLISPGDVNGDGLDDVVVGNAATKEVIILFGNRQPLGVDLQLSSLSRGSRAILNTENALTFLSPAGDINGDGLADFFVGETGKAKLILGRSTWEDRKLCCGMPLPTIDLDPGQMAIGVGDVDGDQFDDFAATTANTVHLFNGSENLTNQNIQFSQAIATFASTDATPRVAPLGDVNKDTPEPLADLLFSNGNTPQLVYGRAGGGWGVSHTFNYTPAPSGFLVGPGDVNADGCNDILLGNAADNAYLVLGAGTGCEAALDIIATFTGVAGAAPMPYAAGADMNSDDSSDLALIPLATGAAAMASRTHFGDVPYINPLRLPQAPVSRRMPSFQMAGITVSPPGLWVDDDYCAACPNDGHTWGTDAFDTIPGALAVAAISDTIRVQPGVYPSLEIGPGNDYVTISGIDADAVFIDGDGGQYGVYIHDRKGVQLDNLTIRNADRGVWLASAGLEGYDHPRDKTTLDHVLIHSFTNAVYSDRASTLVIKASTLAGGGTSGEHIWADSGTPDPSLVRSWNSPTDPADLPENSTGGGSLLVAEGNVYALPGGSSNSLYRYDVGGNAWTALANSPLAVAPGSAASSGDDGYIYTLRGGSLGKSVNGPIYAIAVAPNGDVYVGGSFSQLVNPNGTTESVNNIAVWNGVEWDNLDVGVQQSGFTNSPTHPRDAAVMALAISGDNLYVGGRFVRAGALTVNNIATWNITNQEWRDLGSSSTGVSPGGCGGPPRNPAQCDVFVSAIAISGNNLYAGGAFAHADNLNTGPVARYDIAADTWHTLGSHIWNGPVHALGVSGSDVYAAGNFTQAGTVSANRIARWNGSSWNALGSGLNHVGKAIAISGSDVYVGGSFTQAGGAGANYIARWNGAWSALGSGLNGPVETIALNGGNVYVGGSFLTAGGADARYTAVWNGGWASVGTGAGAEEGGAAQPLAVHTLAVTGADQVYPGGQFTAFDGGEVINLALWGANSYRHNISGNSWNAWSKPPVLPGEGAAMASDGSGNVYVLFGNDQPDFYRYATSTSTWEQLEDLPGDAGSGASLTWLNGRLYAAQGDGNKFHVYDPDLTYWTTLPDAPTILEDGAALAGDGGQKIYALQGGNGPLLLRYDAIKKQWETLPDNAPQQVNIGGGLVYLDRVLYALRGGGNPDFWTYGPVGIYPTKLTFDEVAFVAPSTVVSPTWFTLDPTDPPEDYLVNDAGTSQWVGGGTWQPTISTPAVTLASARFQDVDYSVYRIGEGSSLTAGYFTYHPNVHVYPSEAACDRCGTDLTWGTTAFDNIQQAIDTGAAIILVHPGQYPQSFYLVSGVQIRGAGAAQTIIEPPPGSPLTLVSAEGVPGVTMALFTLDGDNLWNGLRVDGDALNMLFTRNIVRNTDTAIALDEDGTDVEISNLTVVNNTNGIAGTNCAPIDVRNTIFAFNGGTALSYQDQPCTGTQLHQYNAYWTNGQDFSIDGAAVQEPGLGEIFANPIFVNPTRNDFRLYEASPAIDAGNPADPVPPGTGGRVDMGYLEHGRAAFYADDDYCETCLNDGLSWQIDAFDNIQDALDASAQALQNLGSAKPDDPFTVGVAEGDYDENLTMTSHTRLVGVGAEKVIVDGGGNGSVLLVRGGAKIEIRGMTFRGSGNGAQDAGIRLTDAAQHVRLYRNILRNNQNGVLFEKAASGDVIHNTAVDNMAAGLASDGQNTSATVINSIFATNGTGLKASNNAKVHGNYNLLFNTGQNYDQVTPGADDIAGQDPLFAGADLGLQINSPAVDKGSLNFPVLVGGGSRSDMGYRELTAVPIPVLLGKEGISSAVGNVGVAEVEVGISAVSDPKLPIKDTLPTTWQAAAVTTPGQTGSYWSLPYTPPADGLYRVYTRAADRLANKEAQADDWYEGSFVADGAAPVVTWQSPANGSNTVQAAVKAEAQVSDYIGSGANVMFSVEHVYFEHGGATYPAQWTNDTWDPSGQLPRPCYAFIPLPSDGNNQTITAVAVDLAGNETRQDININVSTPADVATIVSPDNGQALNTNPLPVSGYARFTSAGTTQVQVRVDADPWMAATLESPGAAFTAWSASVPVSGPGNHVVTTDPSHSLMTSQGTQAGGQTDSTAGFILDITPPNLAMTSPALGGFVTETAELLGTASDADSGLKRVEISVDGGFTWEEANESGGQWDLAWSVPITYNQSAAFLVQTRATDNADNTTLVSRTVVADLQPPTGLAPVTFSIPEGSHLDQPQDLTIGWQPAVDNSGAATVAIEVNQTPDTVATQAASGSSHTANLSSDGEWYVHLAAYDVVNNLRQVTYGPWHVGTFRETSVVCGQRQQTVELDGYLDKTNGEWREGHELLDDDERPFATQKLYTTWDANTLYLAWEGSLWILDGTLWAYLDTKGGGANQGPDPLGSTLPFAADVAVQVTSNVTGTLWQYDGAAWQSSALNFVHDGSDATEIAIPWDISQAGGGVHLLAFALGDDGAPWSAFPTTNQLAGAWTDSYYWADVCNIFEPNAGQPQASNLSISIGSPQDGLGTWGAGDPLAYRLTVRSSEAVALTNVPVQLDATAGLAYQGVTGVTCATCPPGGDAWQVTIPTLDPDVAYAFTLTAQLAPSLTGIELVTTTADLPTSNVDAVAYSHRIDGVAPTVSIGNLPGNVYRPGTQLLGVSEDQGGGYVETVEYRIDSGAWTPASGTSIWTGIVNLGVGATEFLVEARATDNHGNVSDVASATFYIDTVGPQFTSDIPYTITEAIAEFSGTTFDPYPVGGEVASVALQFDAPDAPWLNALVYAPENGQQNWLYTWNVPTEDCVPHTIQLRGADFAENQTLAAPISVLVDNVPPAITMTQIISQVMLGDYHVTLGPPSPPPVLQGQVTDGCGLRPLELLVYTPDGRAYYEPVFQQGDDWWYVPALQTPLTGYYGIRATFTDNSGNITVYEAPGLLVVDTPVAGLQADAQAPAYATLPAVLTATVSAGTNITYTWYFGDNSPPLVTDLDPLGDGSVVDHVYPDLGNYVATVVARNSMNAMTTTVNVMTTTIPITVTDMPIGYPLVDMSFDDGFPPAGWLFYKHDPISIGWQRTMTQAHSGEYSMFHDDEFGQQDSWLVTPKITPSESSELSFWQYERYPDYYYKHSIWVSTGSPDPKDGNYVELADLGPGVESEWQQVVLSLEAYAGQAIYVGFRYEGEHADEWYVDDVLITTDLWATNDSPTTLKQSTTLTATVGSGTNVVFDWDFGDGQTGIGAVINHTYPSVGVYTATVNAHNSVSSVTTTTTVKVQVIIYLPTIYKGAPQQTGRGPTPIRPRLVAGGAAPIGGHTFFYSKAAAAAMLDSLLADIPIDNLQADNDSPTPFGSATDLTTSVQAGTNITYTWDFGDGSLPLITGVDLFGTGLTVSHTYTAVGVHTATVVAKNNVSVVTATTSVTITDVPIGESLLNEAFAGPNPPPGWGLYKLTPVSIGWQQTMTQAHSGDYSMFHNDEFGQQDSWLVTPPVEPTEESELVFWQYEKYPDYYHKHSIWVTTGSPDPKDDDYVELADLGAGTEDTWEPVTVTLASYAGQTIYVAFRYEGDHADEWYVDDVKVTAGTVWASSNSPTSLGKPTTFTAMVGSGTGVVYDWDFGDGQSSTGAVIDHTYPATGVYTATVRAHNSSSEAIDTTAVEVQAIAYLPLIYRGLSSALLSEPLAEQPIYNLQADAESPVDLTFVTFLTATVQTGTNITYTWDFGDGSAPQATEIDVFGLGSVVSHTYPAIGPYTATVVAHNSLNTMTATTPLLITDVPVGKRLLDASFDDAFPPTDWGFYKLTPIGDGWQRTTIRSHSGDYSLFHNDDFDNQDSWLVLPRLTPHQSTRLTFWQFQRYQNHYGKHSIWLSTGSPDPKKNDYVEFARLDPGQESTWEKETVGLGAYEGQIVYVALRYEGDYADEWYVDDVQVTSDLWAASDGPTTLGQPTTLLAVVGSGTNVVYDWDLGDGETGQGTVLSHTYSAVGFYTATITAHNSINAVTATTSVRVKVVAYLPLIFKDVPSTGQNTPLVDLLIRNLEAGNDGPTYLTTTTNLTATVETGTNITYTWDFGDGSPPMVTDVDVLGAGSAVTHTYTSIGVYTATVVAQNSVSALTDTTSVAVQDIPVAHPLLDEGFEDLNLPEGWSAYKLTPVGIGWRQAMTYTHGGNYSLFHDDDVEEQDSWLVTPRITPSEASVLSFWQYDKYQSHYDKHSLWVSIGSPDPKDNDFVEFIDLGPGPESTWQRVSVPLNLFVGQPIYIAFRYEGDNADEWYVDDVKVTAGLWVTNDSPTRLTVATTLGASAGNGTNVIYDWDLGDGEIAQGAVVSHTYPVAGIYTATVTAHNSANEISATTRVRIHHMVALPQMFKQYVGGYYNDFEGPVGAEWSERNTELTPNGHSFLGQFVSEEVLLTLTDLPYHRKVTVSFDLYVIRSWDGNSSTYGPDIWDLTVAGGDTLLHTTFSNWDDSGGRQAYPGSYPGDDYPAGTGMAESQSLGYEIWGMPMDSVYHLSFTFDHTDDILELIFSTSGLAFLEDESWGLDNVAITWR